MIIFSIFCKTITFIIFFILISHYFLRRKKKAFQKWDAEIILVSVVSAALVTYIIKKIFKHLI
jgi:purine-cytosine permease-like protein